MTELKKRFGYRLRVIRRTLNLTQQEFAQEIGIDKNTYWNYENDRRNPDSDILKKILKIANVNLNWLIAGCGERFIPEENIRIKNLIGQNDVNILKTLRMYLRRIEILYAESERKKKKAK